MIIVSFSVWFHVCPHAETFWDPYCEEFQLDVLSPLHPGPEVYRFLIYVVSLAYVNCGRLWTCHCPQHRFAFLFRILFLAFTKPMTQSRVVGLLQTNVVACYVVWSHHSDDRLWQAEHIFSVAFDLGSRSNPPTLICPSFYVGHRLSDALKIRAQPSWFCPLV